MSKDSENTYFCRKCGITHDKNSKIGREHYEELYLTPQELYKAENMTTGKSKSKVVDIREKELVERLSELFGKLNKSNIGIQDRFDTFRSYFRGMQDGFLICLHSLNIEPTENERSITEMRIDIIIHNYESGKNDVKNTWDELDRELPLSRIYK